MDSVPHGWLLDILNIYKISPKIVDLLKEIITHWQVTMKSQVNNKSNIINPIRITRGIFQGDSLIPLWFCLALNSLSAFLNDKNEDTR